MTVLDHTGLSIRSGADLAKIHGFGHSEKAWWVIADLEFNDGGKQLLEREVLPCNIVYDHDSKPADDNMKALSKALMEYLLDVGEFDDRGDWHSC